MTYKAIRSDPYATRHATAVDSVIGGDIALASGISFAFTCGPEGDHDSIGVHPVTAARKHGPRSVGTLAADRGLVEGQAVDVEIDDASPFLPMRLHSAADVVPELFHRRLPGVGKIGANIARGKARIVSAWPESIAPLLPDLTAQANRIIADDLAIRTGLEDGTTQRRYREITGFPRVPGSGTHVRRTGRTGPVRLKRNSFGQGRERVGITLAG